MAAAGTLNDADTFPAGQHGERTESRRYSAWTFLAPFAGHQRTRREGEPRNEYAAITTAA